MRLVVEGNYFEVACRAAGTTKWTVQYWQKLYEAGAEHAQVYADFFTALARAQSIAESNAVRSVRSGRPGWQGDAWFLERRWRNRWGNKQKTEIGGEFGIVHSYVEPGLPPSPSNASEGGE